MNFTVYCKVLLASAAAMLLVVHAAEAAQNLIKESLPGGISPIGPSRNCGLTRIQSQCVQNQLSTFARCLKVDLQCVLNRLGLGGALGLTNSGVPGSQVLPGLLGAVL